MRAAQDALAQAGVGQVEDEIPVDVVASDVPVDEALVERERRRVRKGLVEVRPDVGQRLDRRLEILQVLDQVGPCVVDQPGGGVAERPEFVERA